MIAAVLLPVCPAAAMQDKPADPPAEAPQTAPPTESEDDEPSLDELLGLEEDESAATAEEIARREAEAELQRRLDEEGLLNDFALALEKMVISAELLEVAFDPGLGTQRVQEEILARLDSLIDQARKMQSMCSGGAGSSGSRRQPQPPPGPQQSQAEQNESRNQNASDGQATGPPPRRDGDVNTIFEESRTEWGSLPQRVRDMLLQGRREKFSSLYEQLTREYYRRLAEEGSS